MVEKFPMKKISDDRIAKSKVIAIMNHKGGCGKSALCDALAHYMYNNGYSVLVIDTDPQANITQRFGILSQSEYLDRGVGQMYLDMRLPFSEKIASYPICIQHSGNYDSAVALGLLAGAVNSETYADVSKTALGSMEKCKRSFKDRMNVYRNYFDYILIDTAPAIENNTSNEMTLSVVDDLIIPFDGSEAVSGLELILNWGSRNFEYSKTKPNVIFAMTKYQTDTAAFKMAMNRKLNKIGEKLYEVSVSEYKGGISGESNNVMYRIMTQLFGNHVCKHGIPERKVLKNNVYSSLNNGYDAKRKYDMMCGEIISKLNSDRDNVFDMWESNDRAISVKLNNYMMYAADSRRNGANINHCDFAFRQFNESMKV